MRNLWFNGSRSYIPAISIAIPAILMLFYLTSSLNISWLQLLKILPDALYVPFNENGFGTRLLLRVPVQYYFYICSIVAIVIFGISVLIIPGGKDLSRDAGKTFSCLLIALFLSHYIPQFAGMVKTFRGEYVKFNGKSPEERNRLSTELGFLYDLAEFCHKQHPGKHRAVFHTKFEKGSSQYTNLRHFLSYYLLPIDMAGISDYPEDCYVLAFPDRSFEISKDRVKKALKIGTLGYLLILNQEKGPK